MNFTEVRRVAQHAWEHRHMLYSYALMRLAMISPFTAANAFLHKLRGVKVGKEVRIAHDVLIDPMEPKSVTLEDHVTISPRVTIYAHTNPTMPLYEYMGPRTVDPVIVGEGSWIGTGAIILPGAIIGKYCVIGAGSVVTTNIPHHTLAAGVPARLVRTLKKIHDIPKDATRSRVLVLHDKHGENIRTQSAPSS